ncbi:hypothetical protein PHYPSEUDO_010402 [Phytophthora pseudosyringae]|uniref:Uncharacterized protein n=1 Tax=Phytophthora pseudosyringae TaxID=221518 RepID=A0A8T1VB23_9STRA|nr:hypothetical protein PHYPSEUDO_010402 [Phytophthora pseudosyringae]
MASSSADTVAVFNDTALVVDAMQLDAAAVAWVFVPLTQETAQVALDAVRYQANYARTVTTRLCLHYINTIRTRVSSSVSSFLFSVDGCELSQVEPTGRCDIYYCRPYTYELQLAQKAIGSDVFIVQSIYKTVDQKPLDQFREEISNLDFSFGLTGLESMFYPEEAPIQTEEPLAWQATAGEAPDNQIVDKQSIARSTGVNKHWEAHPIPTQPLSIRAEPVSMVATQRERAAAAAGSATVIAVIGIAAVSASMIAFVVALAMVRWRTRSNSAKFALTKECSPLSSLPKDTENTVSISSRESITSDTKQLTGFFI